MNRTEQPMLQAVYLTPLTADSASHVPYVRVPFCKVKNSKMSESQKMECSPRTQELLFIMAAICAATRKLQLNQ